ncbi:hypothetical protein PspS04_11790 [Pseudomonas sp. S04]|jgi:hypothetical protein|nr:hypothetical protein PspS04_11790 [Pseudomonas sp. S04]QHF33478.1 hypothetical protein PspS19_11795 [Pseudomonas sp. S19]
MPLSDKCSAALAGQGFRGLAQGSGAGVLLMHQQVGACLLLLQQQGRSNAAVYSFVEYIKIN